jgi:hypothetical protein
MTRISRLLRAVAVAAALTGTASGVAQEIKLPPADEAAGDATWVRFKARLLDALVKRDQKFVISVIAGKIRNTSEKDGVAEFRRLWEPHSVTSPLWVELPKILFLGGAFVKRDKATAEFCGPYVHYKWPDNAPADASGAIIAKEALMKTKPSATAETLLTLSYDLVKVLDWEIADEDKTSRQKWVQIQAGAGAGFVPEEQVRSPLEYRACFVKSGAAWRMTALEVGE